MIKASEEGFGNDYIVAALDFGSAYGPYLVWLCITPPPVYPARISLRALSSVAAAEPTPPLLQPRPKRDFHLPSGPNHTSLSLSMISTKPEHKHKPGLHQSCVDVPEGIEGREKALQG